MGIADGLFLKGSKATALAKDIDLLRKTPLLDPVWYRQNYEDLRDRPIDVARHYLEYGAREGRNPGPAFDTKSYLARNPDVASSGLNPLVHYLLYGSKRGAEISGFNAAGVADNSSILQFKRYCVDVNSPAFSEDQRQLHFSVFDESWYVKKYGNSIPPGVDPFDHYLIHGVGAGHNPCQFFQADWYLDQYPDVVAAGLPPTLHYLLVGAAEGRDPGPDFSTTRYLHRYPDVARTDGNPLAHYIRYGQSEGRKPERSSRLWTLIGRAALLAEGADRRHEVHEFLMQNQIEPNGLPFGYRSTGSDPQLLIKIRIPSGFFRIRASLIYLNANKHFPDYCSLQIFIGDDDGFRPGNCWTYFIKEGKCNFDDILFNSKDVNYLRLDPLDTTGEFQIEHLSIWPISIDEGVYAVRQHLNTRKALGRAYTLDVINSLNSRNILEVVRDMSDSEPSEIENYQHWIKIREVTDLIKQDMQVDVATMEYNPTISIIMPVYKSDHKFLNKAISSVLNQIYSNWELLLVDDGSDSPELIELLSSWQQRDRRIRVRIESVNRGISHASNIALTLAQGEFIALVDHDDEITPHALYAIARAINDFPQADMLYSDEDKIDVNGVRSGPFFKPDWSPEFFLSCMYTCHLGVYRKSLVDSAGGFRSEYDAAQDYDLALRVSRKARGIVHIPDVLYHWRTLENSTATSSEAKPTAALAARRAVQAALEVEGLSAIVDEGPFKGSQRVKLILRQSPKISIVIPTAAKRIHPAQYGWYVLDLLRSIQKSTYNNFNIVLVHNGDIEEALDSELQTLDFQIVRVLYPAPAFNMADKINLGVQHASGDYVLLLNDDMSVISEDWLEEMLMWMQRDGVAGVGAKLLFPDDTVQHAGVLLLSQGPSHVYYGAHRDYVGLAGGAVLTRNYCALTGACLLVRRQDYLDIGGIRSCLSSQLQ